jgi:uncharacterized membrane protein YqjE
MERSEGRTTRIVQHNGRGQLRDADEVPIGELLRRITGDASLLVQQEITLARAELQSAMAEAKTSLKSLAIAALLAIPGALALTAFLIIALGEAIDSYWASALIVGLVLVIAAAALARRGTSAMKDGRLSMDETTQSLRDDARWGKEELRAFKRELTA